MDNLEERLVREHLISEEQLALAYQEAKRLNKSIWVALEKMDVLNEEQIALFFSEELGIPYVRPNDYAINEELINVVEEDFCRQNMLIPLFKIDNLLYVAMTNPLDTTVLDGLSARAGCIIEPLVASPSAVLQAIDSNHGIDDRFSFLQKLVLRQRPLSALPFSREAERIPLSVPVKLRLEGTQVVFRSKIAVDGLTKDISAGGTAVGLEIFLYLPKGTAVSMEFQPQAGILSSSKGVFAKGEIVYCRMEKGRQYFLGIKFTQVDKESIVTLLKQASGEG